MFSNFLKKGFKFSGRRCLVEKMFISLDPLWDDAQIFYVKILMSSWIFKMMILRSYNRDLVGEDFPRSPVRRSISLIQEVRLIFYEKYSDFLYKYQICPHLLSLKILWSFMRRSSNLIFRENITLQTSRTNT